MLSASIHSSTASRRARPASVGTTRTLRRSLSSVTRHKAPLLHPVQDAGYGGVLQAEDLGQLLGRAGAPLPQTAEHTVLPRSDVELGQPLGKHLKYTVLRGGQQIIDAVLQLQLTRVHVPHSFSLSY